jgi:CHAD domain-containing protein
VRLVRPALGGQYQTANTMFRDAARHLSPLRDAHALAETFDDLLAAQRDHVPDDGLEPVRAELQARSEAASAGTGPDDPRVSTALELLYRGESMIDGWTLDATGFDAVAGGLQKTYRRGRKALAAAIDSPTAENFHEHRKRTKYTWYHVRLLQEVAPSVTGPLRRRLHDLSDALGDEHDLAVLSGQLRDDPDSFGGGDAVHATLIVIEGQRADLQRRAIRLGTRLHAEKPKAFAKRFAAYWDAWQTHGDELPAGEIAGLAAA